MTFGAFCLIHLPDFLCIYRILASITALFLGAHPLTPTIFTSALLSDLFDGWIFRRYVKDHPAWHPWNPLPITLDPLSDFVLLICGVLYASIYILRLSLFQAIFQYS